MENSDITITTAPPDKDFAAFLRAGLDADLKMNGFPADRPTSHLTIAIRNKDSDGRYLGGLAGVFDRDWLLITELFVCADKREQGLGKKLLQLAEKEVLKRNSVGIVLWSSTGHKKALEFYKAVGFEICGQVPDCPRGHTQTMFAKVLNPQIQI